MPAEAAEKLSGRPQTTNRFRATSQGLLHLGSAEAVVQLWSHERQQTIRIELDERRHPEVEDPSGRLGVYLARTRTPLDLLALLTLWIVVVPYTDFGSKHHISTIALVVRIGVSVVYAIDMTVRATLAKRHLYYLLTHPVGVLSVPLPPIRLIFSLRLLRSIFRRGNLWRFLLAASVLVLKRRDHRRPVRATCTRVEHPHVR